MSIKDAVETVLTRNAFYRDGYRLLLRINIIQGVILALLVAALLAMILSIETRHVYFATTADGRIIKVVPLNEPLRSRAEVVAWAAGKAQEIMRFGYNDYRQRLQQSSGAFTQTGWESFTKAMREARIIDTVEARKLTVAMDIDGAPEVKLAAEKDGVYTWVLQFPVTIRFDGNDPPAANHIALLLQVVRVSTLQNPEGISIEQWIAAEAKS